MKTVNVPITQPKPNKLNPRKIKDKAFYKLVESVKKSPNILKVRPPVVDEDYVLWGGEKRFLAAKEAGIERIDVIVITGWSLADKKEFMLKDNIHYGEFDEDALMSWDKDLLLDTGFDFGPSAEGGAQEEITRKTGVKQIIFRFPAAEHAKVMKELKADMEDRGTTSRENWLRYMLGMDENPK